MPAATGPRQTLRKHGGNNVRPVKAGAVIFAGTLVAIDATGNAVAGATALNLVTDGRALANAIGGATDGTASVEVEAGVFRWDNSTAADAITLADVGRTAWLVDNQTVARTNGGNTRSTAGTIVDVEALGVWVRSGVVAG